MMTMKTTMTTMKTTTNGYVRTMMEMTVGDKDNDEDKDQWG